MWDWDYIWKVLSTPFVRFDGWDVIGFVGQGVFFSRFVVQWWASEKKKRNVLPVMFWYLSMAGAIVSLLYYIHLGKLPLIAAGFLSLAIYGRNLHIYFRRLRSRRGLVFASDSPVVNEVIEEESPAPDAAGSPGEED